jgi:hypothetical protein
MLEIQLYLDIGHFLGGRATRWNRRPGTPIPKEKGKRVRDIDTTVSLTCARSGIPGGW